MDTASWVGACLVIIRIVTVTAPFGVLNAVEGSISGGFMWVRGEVHSSEQYVIKYMESNELKTVILYSTSPSVHVYIMNETTFNPVYEKRTFTQYTNATTLLGQPNSFFSWSTTAVTHNIYLPPLNTTETIRDLWPKGAAAP